MACCDAAGCLLPSGLYRRLRSLTGSCVRNACGLYRRSGIGLHALTLPQRLSIQLTTRLYDTFQSELLVLAFVRSIITQITELYPAAA
jgi:hypothetical protein